MARYPATTRPPTTQQFVLAAIRESITTGRLRPGQPIRQDAVAEELGVSRVPLREALRILETEGQVTYAPHRGYSVTELSLDDLLEVYRLRDLLESEAARVAVERLGEADLERIAAAREDLEHASAREDLAAMTSANRRFHFALLEPARLPRLLRIVRQLWDSTDAYRSVYYNSPDNRQRVEHEHRRIADAAHRRDAEELVTLLGQHRDNAVRSLRATIPE